MASRMAIARIGVMRSPSTSSPNKATSTGSVLVYAIAMTKEHEGGGADLRHGTDSRPGTASGAGHLEWRASRLQDDDQEYDGERQPEQESNRGCAAGPERRDEIALHRVSRRLRPGCGKREDDPQTCHSVHSVCAPTARF